MFLMYIVRWQNISEQAVWPEEVTKALDRPPKHYETLVWIFKYYLLLRKVPTYLEHYFVITLVSLIIITLMKVLLLTYMNNITKWQAFFFFQMSSTRFCEFLNHILVSKIISKNIPSKFPRLYIISSYDISLDNFRLKQWSVDRNCLGITGRIMNVH